MLKQSTTSSNQYKINNQDVTQRDIFSTKERPYQMNEQFIIEADAIRLFQMTHKLRPSYSKVENPRYRNLQSRILIQTIRQLRKEAEAKKREVVMAKIIAIRHQMNSIQNSINTGELA